MINQLKYFFTFVVIVRDCKSGLLLFGKDILKKSSLILKKYTFNLAVAVYEFLIKGTFLMQYISSAYDNKVYLPLELIRDAVANNYTDSLCYYLWIKKAYHKPVIYNYNLRKIGAGLKCSPTTVKHHLDVLKQRGLVETAPARNGISSNLHLKSTNDFFRESNFMVPVKISYNKAEQRNLLRFAIIKRNLHNQVRTFDVKSNALKYYQGLAKTYHEIKKGIRLAKLYPDSKILESSMQNEMTLSNKKFGNLCNRSRATGLKIQKAFNDLDLIVSAKRVRLITPKHHSRREFFRLELGKEYFISGTGQVYKRLTNSISMG